MFISSLYCLYTLHIKQGASGIPIIPLISGRVLIPSIYVIIPMYTEVKNNWEVPDVGSRMFEDAPTPTPTMDACVSLPPIYEHTIISTPRGFSSSAECSREELAMYCRCGPARGRRWACARHRRSRLCGRCGSHLFSQDYRPRPDRCRSQLISIRTSGRALAKGLLLQGTSERAQRSVVRSWAYPSRFGTYPPAWERWGAMMIDISWVCGRAMTQVRVTSAAACACEFCSSVGAVFSGASSPFPSRQHVVGSTCRKPLKLGVYRTCRTKRFNDLPQEQRTAHSHFHETAELQQESYVGIPSRRIPIRHPSFHD